MNTDDRITMLEKWYKTPQGVVIRVWSIDDWATYQIEETAMIDIPFIKMDWGSYCWPKEQK